MARRTLATSATLLLLVGAALLFIPEAAATALSLPAGADAALPLAGAGALAFAALNWVGRGAIYGGVYGRPIVVGNFGFGAVTALTLIRMAVGEPTTLTIAAAAAFLAYWAAFAWLLLRPPFEQPQQHTA